MFVRWNDPSIRYTGRWVLLPDGNTDTHRFVNIDGHAAVTSAPGSYFEFAYSGDMVVLHFDTNYRIAPLPHLWISVDDGASIEVPVDLFLRIQAKEKGTHIVKVIFKSSVEQMARWYPPLVSAISFLGYEANAAAELPPDDRRVIEFLGDSITEGVLIDVDFSDQPINVIDQFDRVYQDDSMANYAALTAEALDLRMIRQAYGAIGLTRSGCGAVPRAAEIYPFVCDGVPYTGLKPDIVVINHGANDRNNPGDYIMRYEELVDMIRERTPDAVIVCLGAFVGAFDADLRSFVESYNRKHEKPIHFISTNGWVPAEPLHPMRDGHRIIADHLIPLLREII